MKKLCIYHAECADGFGAAWAVRMALGDTVEFHPGRYQEPPPDVAGREVILVDFSYKRDVLISMALDAKCILILDHHKSAEADLVDLPKNVQTIFDMDRSGARMAWNYFHPGLLAPPLILRIEDRDLWRFKYHDTKEVMAAVFSYPFDFEIWDDLMEWSLKKLAAEGKAILRKHMKDINDLIRVSAIRCTISGHNVPVLNAPYFYSSDAGHILSQDEPFAACYYETKKGVTFSLRSSPDGIDVSKIAALYGGGGHKHAAGFTIEKRALASILES